MCVLNRQKIVVSNLVIEHPDDGDAVLTFNWIGLRRHRRHGSFIRDENAELGRRLSGIFPRLNDFNVRIDATAHGRRWNRLVQFRIASDQLEYMMNLQPVAVGS